MNGKAARVFLSIADTQCRPSRLSRYNTGWGILRSHSCHRVDHLPSSCLPAPSWSLDTGIVRLPAGQSLSNLLSAPIPRCRPFLPLPRKSQHRSLALAQAARRRACAQCKKSLTTWSLEGALPPGIGLPDPAFVSSSMGIIGFKVVEPFG
jgi:hypothetical protein